jgi:hypothetical protein
MGRGAWSIASVAFGAALAFFISTSCSSSYVSGASDDAGPDAMIAAGSEGGACYPNDTCNAGLTCASHLCVRVDAGGTGNGQDASSAMDASGVMTTDASPSDGGIGDGSVGCAPTDTTRLLKYTCTNQDALCIQTAGIPSALCAGTCSGADISALCLGNAGCDVTIPICCANDVMLQPGATCPLVIQAIASTQCVGSCLGATTVCENDAQCPSGQKCFTAEIPTTQQPFIIGLCQAP